MDNCSTVNYFTIMQTNQIFRLIGRIHRETDALICRELARRGHPGLGPSHGSILSKLYDQGPMPMGGLARSIGRKKNTVTVLVKRMEVDGYVLRHRSEEDSRVTLVSLTEKGAAFRRDFEAVSVILLNSVWGDMPQGRKEVLVSGLETIVQNLE